MKKVLLVLAVIFMCFTSKAQQFTNSSFETWAANMPQGWSSLGFMGMNLCEVAKTTDVNSGNYAVKVAPKMLNPAIASMMQVEAFAIPGFLTNGTINFELLLELLAQSDTTMGEMDYMNLLTNLITGGLQIEESNQPSTINGYYKFNYQEETETAYDYFEMTALLFGEVEGIRTIVGLGAFYSDDVFAKTEGYQQFEMPIYYVSQQPANEVIYLAIVGCEETRTANFPELYLDDIMINYESSLEDVANTQEISVYPNPSNGKLRINCENNSHIQIVNPLGQVVKEINNYTPNSVIEIEQSGIYFVKVGGRKATKLIVK